MTCSEFIKKNSNRAKFANKIIIPNPLYTLDLIDLKISEIEVEDAEYDVTNIIGSDRDSFYNLTWEKAVNEVLKNKDDYNFKCNDIDKLGYYNNSTRQSKEIDTWSITDIEGKGFITAGNHRSIVCKYLHDLNKIDKTIKGLSYVRYIKLTEEGKKEFDKYLAQYSRLYYISVFKNIIKFLKLW